MGATPTPRRLEPHTPARPAPPADCRNSAADAAFVVWAAEWRRAAEAAETVTLAVAYSGGADSTALLAAAARHWPGRVLALHVHHGLQAAADAFVLHCQAQCAAWKVPLQTVRVNGRAAPGASPEEAARQARYLALAEQARVAGADVVLLAQHADDQVETLLLALSRGAGVAGLAAMPAAFTRHGVRFARPLLGVAAARIRADLHAAGIGFVEDPSNAHAGYTRNRIRHQVLPALEQALPGFRATFARSARHAAQAQQLLEELADADLLQVGLPPRLVDLQQLSRVRQGNVLRRWLRQVDDGRGGSAAQLNALLDQIARCTTRGHRIELKVGRGQVVRQGAHLSFRRGPL